MNCTEKDVQLLQLAYYFISVCQYQFISLREAQDEIWLGNPKHPEYPVIRLSQTRLSTVFFDKTRILKIHQSIRNLFRRNCDLLDIHISDEAVQDQEEPRPQLIQKGGFFVLFAWLYGIFIGALPFVLAGRLNWIQSSFESVSGWTTTGLSVLDVTQVSPIFLFHRGFMQYCGGLGFVMVMTLFIQNKQSMNLFQAEGHSDQLTPNLGRTVRLIVLMYTTFLALGVAAYVLAGMNFFDSLIHAMCALSTGGFSTRVESIGYYQSPLIEFITIVLMVIGTTNFAALLLLVRRQARKFMAVSEVRFMGLVLAMAIPLTALVLFFAAYADLPGSFRIAFFEVVSALSTSGFSTVGYTQWPQAAVFVLIVMMLIGGGIGSTAGGLKLTR